MVCTAAQLPPLPPSGPGPGASIVAGVSDKDTAQLTSFVRTDPRLACPSPPAGGTSAPPLRPLRLVVADTAENELPPGQQRSVPYALVFPLPPDDDPNGTAGGGGGDRDSGRAGEAGARACALARGLCLHRVALVNLSTQHSHTLLLSTFVDTGAVSQAPAAPAVPVAAATPATSPTTAATGTATGTGTGAGSAMLVAAATGLISVAAHDPSPARDREGLGLSDGPSAAAPGASLPSSSLAAAGVSLYPAASAFAQFTVAAVTDAAPSTPTPPLPPPLPLSRAGAHTLCEWAVQNDSDRPLLLEPLSNLPVAVTLTEPEPSSMTTEPSSTTTEPSSAAAAHALPPAAAGLSGSAESCYDVHVGDLRSCGAPWALAPRARATVRATVRPGDAVPPELAGILHRLLEKVGGGEAGRHGQGQGQGQGQGHGQAQGLGQGLGLGQGQGAGPDGGGGGVAAHRGIAFVSFVAITGLYQVRYPTNTL